MSWRTNLENISALVVDRCWLQQNKTKEPFWQIRCNQAPSLSKVASMFRRDVEYDNNQKEAIHCDKLLFNHPPTTTHPPPTDPPTTTTHHPQPPTHGLGRCIVSSFLSSFQSFSEGANLFSDIVLLFTVETEFQNQTDLSGNTGKRLKHHSSVFAGCSAAEIDSTVLERYACLLVFKLQARRETSSWQLFTPCKLNTGGQQGVLHSSFQRIPSEIRQTKEEATIAASQMVPMVLELCLLKKTSRPVSLFSIFLAGSRKCGRVSHKDA